MTALLSSSNSFLPHLAITSATGSVVKLCAKRYLSTKQVIPFSTSHFATS
jgi:hypothetical protein